MNWTLEMTLWLSGAIIVLLLLILPNNHKTNKILFIGFMRLITFNTKLWCKPTELGWRRVR